MTIEHTKDSDCAGLIDPETDLCTVCGVLHGEPCPHCDGRGFHQNECVAITPILQVHPFTKGQQVEVYDLGGRGGVWVPGTIAAEDDGTEYLTAKYDGRTMAFLREHVRPVAVIEGECVDPTPAERATAAHLPDGPSDDESTEQWLHG